MNSVCVLAAAFLVVTASTPASAADGLLCGVAKQDITPTESVALSGYENRAHDSEGVHDSLYVRAAAFQSGKDRLVLVSTDVIEFYGGTAENFQKALLDWFGLKPSELFLTAIHTHSAPSLSLDETQGRPANAAYTRFLKKRILETVGLALGNLEPVQLGAGSGSSPVGANRREVFYDSAGNPRTWIGRNPSGPADPEVQVVKIVGMTGLKAVLFDYACHSTSLGWDNYLVSGDLHGLAEQFVERVLGDGVVAPAFAGASGDIDPWYRVLPGFETRNGWIQEPVLMAAMLGEEVVHVLRANLPARPADCIRTQSAILELPGKPEGARETTADHPKTALILTVARIGPIAFVGLGGEVLNEIGTAIKSASPFPHTFIITHCNGAAGYLPPRHCYAERGYEVQSSPFASGAAEIVVREATTMLHRLNLTEEEAGK